MSAKAARRRPRRPRPAPHTLARGLLWLDRRFVRDLISLCVMLIGMMMLAADFFIRRPGATPLAATPGFYVAAGFVALGVTVLACWPLRALLLRPRDYYGEDGDADE